MPADLHDVPRLLAAISGVATRAADVVDDPHLRQQLTAAVTVLDDLAGSVDWSESKRAQDHRFLESVAGVVPGVGDVGLLTTDDLLREVTGGINALVGGSTSPDDPQVAAVGRALLAARASGAEPA
jgi:hypothetical protein